MRALRTGDIGQWKITIYDGDHNCGMRGMTNNHVNLNINYCAAILLTSVRNNPACKISTAREVVTAQVGYEISYMKAWYSLKRCRENVYGTWESSVRKLPKFMKALQQMNPVCLDAHQQVLPLAYGVVDEETTSAWKWFFKCIDIHLFSTVSDGICLISDRGSGILSAIDSMPEFRPPRINHRFCLRHVCSNVNSTFKSIVVKDLCWKAGKQSQVCKLNRVLEKINSENPNAYRYLMNIDPVKWTLAHDGGPRRGQLTTNLSESINGALKGARKLPVAAIVDFTFHRVVGLFVERVEKGNLMESRGQRWTSYALSMFKLWEEHSTTHFMRRFHNSNYAGEVFTRGKPQGGGGKTHSVDIRSKYCTCGKWTLFGIPCSHVQFACRDFGLDAEAKTAKLTFRGMSLDNVERLNYSVRYPSANDGPTTEDGYFEWYDLHTRRLISSFTTVESTGFQVGGHISMDTVSQQLRSLIISIDDGAIHEDDFRSYLPTLRTALFALENRHGPAHMPQSQRPQYQTQMPQSQMPQSQTYISESQMPRFTGMYDGEATDPSSIIVADESGHLGRGHKIRRPRGCGTGSNMPHI